MVRRVDYDKIKLIFIEARLTLMAAPTPPLVAARTGDFNIVAFCCQRFLVFALMTLEFGLMPFPL
jgi:hypothetical protein